jgi:cytochrome b561/polyisoprenoid-binding protein YceI
MRYGPVAIVLHWLTAAAVAALLAMGWTMVALPVGAALKFSLYQGHKSVGVTVLLLTLVRLGWRLTHRPPPLPAAMPAWEKRAAAIGHLALYGLLFALPLTGWAVVSTSPLHIPTVLYGVLPWPHLPLPSGLAVNKALVSVHHAAAWTLAVLLAVHVGAALRHHLLLGDDVLARMLPRGLAQACGRKTLVKALPILAALPLLAAAPAEAAQWSMDAGHSTLGFNGTQAGTPFSGRFRRWQAQIDFDPANPAAGHALVTIDMTSATTGDPQKDEALPQSDWFDAKAFPTAVFEATTFRAKGGNAFEAIGTLTIRGVRKDVALPFNLDTTAATAHVSGHLDLVRTDFGIGQGAWSSPEWVALAVAVTFDLTATR